MANEEAAEAEIASQLTLALVEGKEGNGGKQRLEDKLRSRGLDTGGTKAEMFSRLMAGQARQKTNKGGKKSLQAKLAAKGLSTEGTPEEQFTRLMGGGKPPVHTTAVDSAGESESKKDPEVASKKQKTIQDKLEERGLSTEGNQRELFKRLMDATAAENKAATVKRPRGGGDIVSKLAARGLSTEGTKAELFQRLMESTTADRAV